MTYLLGPERWSERLGDRLAFLENCARQAEALSNRFGPVLQSAPLDPELSLTGTDQGSALLLARIGLYISAAEHAFCVNQTSRGKNLIRFALKKLSKAPRKMPFVARHAFFSALIEEKKILIGENLIRIGDWEAGWADFATVTEMEASLPALVFAALGRGEPDVTALILMSNADPDRVSAPSRLSFLARPESAILGLFGLSRPRSFLFFETEDLARTYARSDADRALAEGIRLGQAALAMLEYAYQNRISLLHSGALAWNSVTATTSIIDWPLLMIHVALLRRGRGALLEASPPLGEAVAFIRALAGELARDPYA